MANNKPSCRLFIGSLGVQVTKRDIEELFEKFGTITEVRMNRSFAFVQYADEESSAAALKELNGSSQFGRNIDVQFARGQRTSGGGPSGPDKQDDSPHDRSPIGNRAAGGGRGGGGTGGPGRGPASLLAPFGREHSPFGGPPNRGGGPPAFNDRDGGPPFGGTRDGARDLGGGRGPNDFGGSDRFSGGRAEFERGGGGPPPGRGGDFGGGRSESWVGERGGGPDWGAPERERPDPWNNNGGLPRGPQHRNGPEFRDGPHDFRGLLDGPRSNDFRDRDFGARAGMDRGLDSRNDFRDRGPNDFGRPNFGRDDDHFPGPRGGGFRDEPAHRGDRDFLRESDGQGPPPIWFQEKPPNSDQVPLNTPNAERTNDIEIIVPNKSITDYGEYVETRLKSIGFSVDIMFPNETAPMPRVLGNIASRGTLYAIIVNPVHKLNRSLTLHVLYGTPQEHRNMLIEDAIIFLNRNFENYSKKMAEKRGSNAPPEQVRHLMELVISAARQLTPTQYDVLIQFCINEKMKVEPPASQDSLPVAQQAELQTRILSILNKNSAGAPAASVLAPAMQLPSLNPQPSKDAPSPLLKDPSVQRALDSLIQGGSSLFSAFNNQPRF